MPIQGLIVVCRGDFIQGKYPVDQRPHFAPGQCGHQVLDEQSYRVRPLLRRTQAVADTEQTEPPHREEVQVEFHVLQTAHAPDRPEPAVHRQRAEIGSEDGAADAVDDNVGTLPAGRAHDGLDEVAGPCQQTEIEAESLQLLQLVGRSGCPDYHCAEVLRQQQRGDADAGRHAGDEHRAAARDLAVHGKRVMGHHKADRKAGRFFSAHPVWNPHRFRRIQQRIFRVAAGTAACDSLALAEPADIFAQLHDLARGIDAPYARRHRFGTERGTLLLEQGAFAPIQRACMNADEHLLYPRRRHRGIAKLPMQSGCIDADVGGSHATPTLMRPRSNR